MWRAYLKSRNILGCRLVSILSKYGKTFIFFFVLIFSDLLQIFSDKNWIAGIWSSQLFDCLVFGHGSKLVILHSKFEKESQQKNYQITKKCLLNENHLITSLLCFPITGGSSYIDWTSIIVGIDSGSVLFYSDHGNLLYEQNFVSEPIFSIKTHNNEEIYVSFATCIIVIQTLHLITILKSMKDSRSKSNFNLDEIELVYKKWDYKNSKDIAVSDSVIIGQQKSSTFDHLLNERWVRLLL